MRRVSFVFLGLLALSWPAPAGAQPKKAAAVQKKGKATRGAAPAGTAATSDDNPYGEDTPPSTPAAPAPAAAAPAAEPQSTPASGDAKLDEPPPAATGAAAGPKVSPLTPEPNERASGPLPGAPVDFDRLMADIATLRARVAALTTSLFSSKLRVSVQTEGDDARIESFAVTLDDGVVFKGDAGFLAEDARVVYEHAVAPGSHVLGVEIERRDARGQAFRTWQTSRFSVQVPERKVLDATFEVEDDSDMAEDFPDDQDGSYELEVSLRARVAE